MSTQPPEDNEPNGDRPAWPESQPPPPPSEPPTAPPPPPSQAQEPPSGSQGFSAPPPPQEPGGWQAQEPYSAPEAMRYGWRAVTSNLGAMIGVTLAVSGGLVIAQQVLGSLWAPSEQEMLEATLGADPADAIFGLLELASPPWWGEVIMGMVTTILMVPLFRAALAAVDEATVSMSDFFKSDQLRSVVLVAVILGLVSGIAATLPVLGLLLQLAVSFLTGYVVYFILADGRDAIDALQASAQFALDNAAAVIVVFLLSIPVLIAGLLACVVGLVVAVPVVYVAQAYTFRRLRGEPVVAR